MSKIVKLNFRDIAQDSHLLGLPREPEAQFYERGLHTPVLENIQIVLIPMKVQGSPDVLTLQKESECVPT